MIFRLLYHPHFIKDIRGLSADISSRLESVLLSKLSVAPEIYGKPLSGNLKGYWKLRVGDYRVVYKVVKNEIWVLAVIHRRAVYKDVLKGIPWER